jgi:Zn-dependent protease
MQRSVRLTLERSSVVPVLALGAVFGLMGSRAGVEPLVAGSAGALGGSLSLLVHELGHVRAIRRTSSARPFAISLTWLGACTRVAGRYETGWEQARVALAGPAASFTLAVALTAWTAALPLPRSGRVLVLLLAAFNAALGVLNLAPVSPLDGYKLLVGLVWLIRGSEAKARRVVDRVVAGWAALELVGAGVLAIEKPVLGLAVAALAAGMLGQKKLLARVRR